jgi:hypothetical protein
MKKCSISLVVIKELKIKTVLRISFHPS